MEMKHPGVECDSVEQEAVTMTSVSDTHLDLQYTNRLQMHTHTHMSLSMSLTAGVDITSRGQTTVITAAVTEKERKTVNGKSQHLVYDLGLNQTKGFIKSAP